MALVREIHADCDQPGCSERIEIPFESATQPFIYLLNRGWEIITTDEGIETYCPRGKS